MPELLRLLALASRVPAQQRAEFLRRLAAAADVAMAQAADDGYEVYLLCSGATDGWTDLRRPLGAAPRRYKRIASQAYYERIHASHN